MRIRHILFCHLAIIVLAFATGSAQAEAVKILALGASNTNGRGVSTDQAWPAQLEKLLREKRIDAVVAVNAINGQTSAQILGRARNAITPGTKIVIFDNGGDNDVRRGMSASETNANVSRITAEIKAHGAIAIRAPYKGVAGNMYSQNGSYQGDGHHLSAESHAQVARALLPRVISALHGKK